MSQLASELQFCPEDGSNNNWQKLKLKEERMDTYGKQ